MRSSKVTAAPHAAIPVDGLPDTSGGHPRRSRWRGELTDTRVGKRHGSRRSILAGRAAAGGRPMSRGRPLAGGVPAGAGGGRGTPARGNQDKYPERVLI